MCGPWVANGQLSTHTRTLVGTILTTFSADIFVNFVGTNVIIVHLRVGSMQIVLGREILVRPPRGKEVQNRGVCKHVNSWKDFA